MAAALVQYLKAKIKERFGASDIPDAFILLPEELGGLGLRNPFIPLLQIREKLSYKGNSPDEIIYQMYKEEKEAYEKARKKFVELGSVDNRLRPMKPLYADTDLYGKAKEDVLRSLSREELGNFLHLLVNTYAYCEAASTPLENAYDKLIWTPTTDDPIVDSDVHAVLLTSGADDTKRESAKRNESRWALQMYRDELRETFGGCV